MKHLFAVLAVIGMAGHAWADTINVLGQPLTFKNPRGFCTLGETQRERDLHAITQRAVGANARIVHVGVRCLELDAFKRGTTDTLDHWFQIQLLGPRGEYKRVEAGREIFLAGIAKSSPRLNSEEMSRRFKSAVADAEISAMQVVPLGRDGNAVYYSLRANLAVGGRSRSITALTGVTLINALPISIAVYEGTGMAVSRDTLQPVLQQLLTSLLTEN